MAGQKDIVCGLSQYLSQNTLYRSSEEGKYKKGGLKRLLVFWVCKLWQFIKQKIDSGLSLQEEAWTRAELVGQE